MKSSKSTAQPLLPRFGDGFLEDHARKIIGDPKIALVELVANCWDAGADRVDLKWPTDPTPELIEIKDNGTGMSFDEFVGRWLELNYNRKQAQGEDVVFPVGNQASHRKAFGRNGKGRHSMFCFASEYFVETWKDGQCNRFSVKRSSGTTTSPFTLTPKDQFAKEGHGTIVSAELARNYLSVPVVHDLIGSKFVADPTFKIYLNGEAVELTDLEHLFDVREVAIPGIGNVLVRCVDSRKTGRTSKQHGVAWWVNRRLVGEPSWKGFDDDAYLDARTSEAKRYTFVVEADILADEVEADWSDFKDTETFRAVQAIVRENVLQWLRELMGDVHKSHKLAALEASRSNIKDLPVDSRYHLGQFVDEIQTRLPSLTQKELSATVEVLSKLEKSRSGYVLLEQLAKLQPDDLDELNGILENWSIHEVRIVMSELEWRLKLIERLEEFGESPSSDELHDIQPLFESGLWIFGPEYEAISFVSNRSLVTVVQKLFEGSLTKPFANPRKRPDLVALPNSTIGIYSSDAFDERSEVNGIDKVLIVELKRGGFEITREECHQAENYAFELRKSGKVQRYTTITAFVLGTTVTDEAKEPIKIGEGDTTKIFARTYSTVLHQAHARTFNLLKKIQEVRREELYDPEVEQVVGAPDQSRLFAS